MPALGVTPLQARVRPAAGCCHSHHSSGRQQLAVVARAGGRSTLSDASRGSRREQRSASPELIQLPARNSDTAAIGSSIKYRIKPAKKAAAQPANPISDFVGKLKLAWDIFFPDGPADVTPKEEGKQRLRMILVADRCGMTPSGLTEMKRNILHAIEEFVDIDSEEQIDVAITSEPQVGTVYSVAVPIRRVKPEARLALNGEGEIEDLSFDVWSPDDFDQETASARFPMGT